MTRYLLAALILVLTLATGCSDRGDNTGPVYDGESGVLTADHMFFQELSTQIRNQGRWMLYLKAWVPKYNEWGPPPNYHPDHPLPLLVLLPPEDADEWYYFHHGLSQVANELMAEGLLEPMAIFVPQNDPVLGGYWWAGSGGGCGNYDTLVGGTLIDHIRENALGPGAFDTAQCMTAIGGIGTGAYGAVRAALKHPGRFGSISVINGPMDFDGLDGQGGLIPLFAKAIAEQSGVPFATKWDTSSYNEISRLLTGGAMAFSPHDTLVYPVITYTQTGPRVACPDSAKITGTDTWVRTRYKIAGTETLLPDLISAADFSFQVHLPFDRFGRPYSAPNEPIWDLWLRNSPDSMIYNAESQGRAFPNTHFWVAYSREDDPLGYNVMTRDFAKLLQKYRYDPEIYYFGGYEGNPGWGDEYLTHLLREVLIFHSNCFRQARQNQQGGN
ncbi:MAG TPA: alpha/beta hydrolase-fold protein [candidate division Zixibacteria bacterium]|nr:hypothetical protein [candidate division Zixibacteria bacterium]MDD4917450.1 alpha/beta hydrolase-fold protein [candidate division Zixibacteria bacterium]MDM7971618.1 alpha/beta hydrolase-fold protein [candidate division Zixibacteria bacterium]HOD67788.1 alpha/beta hydrolase-fold protein [candidate division Zixibacteria bacterium]HOZ07002.1 alpha/beta hydrolase-fold protein [candidate division Zixibacteria bacterium]